MRSITSGICERLGVKFPGPTRPTLPTSAAQRLGSYLGYTGRDADILGEAALTQSRRVSYGGIMNCLACYRRLLIGLPNTIVSCYSNAISPHHSLSSMNFAMRAIAAFASGITRMHMYQTCHMCGHTSIST
jgi:hypothetical protein